MIIKSQYLPPPQIPPVDFVSMLMEKTSAYGNKVALLDSATDKSYTYNELNICIRKIGQSLHNDLGLRKDDVLQILCPNSPEYIIMALGAISIGVIVSPVSPLSTVGETVNYLQECDPKYVVTTPEHILKIKKSCRLLNKHLGIITVGNAEGYLSYSSLLNNNGTHVPQEQITNETDVALLPFSSGTTGKPKGVMLTHANLQCYLLQSTVYGMRAFGGDTDVVLLLFLPMYHIYGFVQAMTSCYNGHCLVSMPKYDLHTFVTNVKKYKVTYLPIVPPTVVQLAKHTEIKAEDFDSVKVFFYGAAPVGKDLAKQFAAKFPKQMQRQGYGLTETTAGLIKVPENGHDKPGSTGKAMPGMEVRVVNPDSLIDCNVGEDGEIWCRGGVVMKGYYNRPEETARVLTNDRWFRTGDIGHVDADGYFYVVDRLKELIKYNAFQVPPAELESLLLGHPCIADCAVVGVPDATAGELPRAYVVLKPGKTATEKQIQDYVAKLVSPQKWLRGGVMFISSVPKSQSGKILRRVLKEQIRQELKAKL